MQETTSLSLGDHFERFNSHQIQAVRAGLRLLEEHETKLEALQRALKEGEASGPADYALNDLLAELDAEVPR